MAVCVLAMAFVCVLTTLSVYVCAGSCALPSFWIVAESLTAVLVPARSTGGFAVTEPVKCVCAVTAASAGRSSSTDPCGVAAVIDEGTTRRISSW